MILINIFVYIGLLSGFIGMVIFRFSLPHSVPKISLLLFALSAICLFIASVGAYIYEFFYGQTPEPPIEKDIKYEDPSTLTWISQRRAEYREYLLSTYWRSKRLEVLSRDGYLCVRCGDTATQVHHLSYPKGFMGHEQISNLESICDGCHAMEHGKPIHKQSKQRRPHNPAKKMTAEMVGTAAQSKYFEKYLKIL